jgi:hypothetical protein
MSGPNPSFPASVFSVVKELVNPGYSETVGPDSRLRNLGANLRMR